MVDVAATGAVAVAVSAVGLGYSFTAEAGRMWFCRYDDGYTGRGYGCAVTFTTTRSWLQF